MFSAISVSDAAPSCSYIRANNDPQNRLGLSLPVPSSSNDSSPTLNDDDEEDNEPPSFPLPNSIQRASSTSTSSSSKPPAPPVPTFNFSSPPSRPNDESSDEEDASLPPVRIEEGSLAAPTRTVKLPKKRVKVSIEKGYSQLDWARLKSSGVDLRVCSPSFFLSSSGVEREADRLNGGIGWGNTVD